MPAENALPLAPLDTERRVATPEGCELHLRIAGPVIRARAWLIDQLIRLVIFAIAMTLLGWAEKLGTGIAILLGFVLEWFYPVLFEVLWNGATPGKRLSGLVVLHDDATPVGWGASFTRNTLRFVDFLPFGYACALTTMWLNADQKRLGDLLAGTVVAYRSQSPQMLPGDDFTAAEAPPFALTLAEQRALLEYRQRAATLTEARQFELAETAGPLVHGLRPDAARARLFRIANFLLGRRAVEANAPESPAGR